jgi:hypothetical protein
MDRRHFFGAAAATLLTAAPAAAKCLHVPASDPCVVPPPTGGDDTALIQGVFAACPPRSTVVFPARLYRVSATLEPAGKVLHLCGSPSQADAFPYPLAGTLIVGNHAGPILRMSGGRGPIIDGFSLTNEHPQGGGIALSNVNGAAIRNCDIAARWRGLALGDGVFSTVLDHLSIHSAGNPPGSIGLLTGGHCQATVLDVVGWDNGIRAYGATTNITGCRLEVNRTALVLGLRGDGSNWILSSCSIAGNSFEANDVGIAIHALANSIIQGFGIQGTVNAPSGGPHYGIHVLGHMTNVVVMAGAVNFTSGASPTTRGIYLDNHAHTRTMFSNVTSESVAPGHGWQVDCQIGEDLVTFYQTNSGL